MMGNNPSDFKGPKNPVEQVSWDDCQKFLEKLNAKVGSGAREVRIAHGGTVGICLPGGEHDALLLWGRCSRGWASMRGMARTRATRHTRWARRNRTLGGCTTCTGTYGSGVRMVMMTGIMRTHRRTIRRGLLRAARVIRGGRWFDSAGGCRSAFRSNFGPGIRCSYLGLRVSLVPADE